MIYFEFNRTGGKEKYIPMTEKAFQQAVEQGGRYFIMHTEKNKVQIVTQERFRRMHRSTDYKIYGFSIKIQCACCGIYYKRKPIKETVFWACQNHEKSVSLCRNKPITQDTVEQMFITLFNKLYACHEEILSPLLRSMQELRIRNFDDNTQILDVQKKIAEIKNQIHVLTSLRTKGFLNEEKYHAQVTELNQKIMKLQKELHRLMQSDDEDNTYEQLEILVDFFRKRDSMMIIFEEETFSSLIEKIVIKSPHEAEFYLYGGLKLTEHCPQKTY